MNLINTDKRVKVEQGVIRWIAQMIISLFVYGIILFFAAGRINWTLGWIFLGMNALTQILSAVILIPRRPDMIAERSQIREGTKSWDRILTPLIIAVGPMAVIITAGLDARFGWSAPPNIFWWGSGLIVAFCSQMFVLWAMSTNPFFAATVRIQNDRGQTVINNGPYRLVRHPGYFGSIVFNLVSPLVLGSLWAYLPVLLSLGLILVRTGLEDLTLRNELPGYKEYAAITRYRIIPGVW